MATGVLTNEFLDDFPATKRAGAGKQGKQLTNADVALDALAAEGAPSRVLHLIDYNVDTEGNEVDSVTARQRASGRVPNLKARGYGIADGWVIVARNGSVYAKYFGVGNIPDDFIRKTKAVGEAVPV